MKKENNFEIIDNKILSIPLEHKMRIFISSKCDGKYRKIRHELASVLKKTGFFEVYCFEEEGASTSDARSSYLANIKLSDLLIAIIDNYDGISDAVKLEIDTAKNNNIMQMYFFCNERSEETTSLQEELIAKNGQKFKEIEFFEKIPEEIYKSLLQDIVTNYMLKRIIENKSIDQQKYYVADEEFVPKKFINNNNTYIRNKFLQYLFNRKNIVKNKEIKDIDKLLFNQLEVILGIKQISNNNHKELSKKITEIHNGKTKAIIKKRLVIQNLFLNGKYIECLELLKKLLNSSENNVPNWIRLDIAIDIRYIQSLIDEKENNFSIENIGQKFIDENDVYLYYPYVDRKVKENNEKIIKKYYKINNKSPYEINFENIEYMFDPLIDSFVAAQIYGSIIQTILVRKRLSDLYECLLFECKDHRILVEYIRLLILECDTKKISNIVRTYDDESYILSNDDFNFFVKTFNGIKDKEYKYKCKLLFLANFGYYLDDKMYRKQSEEINEYITKWYNSKNATFSMWNYINNYLKETKYRIGDNNLVSIVINIINSKCTLMNYRDCFNLLSNIDYSKTTISNQHAVLRIIKKYINKKMIGDSNINNASALIIIFCKTATINTQKLEELIENKYRDFYNDELSLELEDRRGRNYQKYIDSQIETIYKTINNSQSGIIVRYSNDPFYTIYKILKYSDDKQTNDTINKIIECIFITLNNKKVEISYKISSLELLNLIVNYYENRNIRKYVINNLKRNKKLIFDGITDGYFNKESKKHLMVIYDLILANNSQKINALFDNIYHNLNNDTYDIIKTLKMIDTYLEDTNINKTNNDVIMFVYYYVISKINDNERDIKYYVCKCLIELTKYKKYQEEALKYILMIMNSCSPEMKVTIVSRIKRIKSNKKYRNRIIEKAKEDSNYFVRFAIMNLQ